MNTNIVHKVPQGKMLRIEAEITDSIINNIKITGDFFIHPEGAITEIEDFLIKKNVRNIEQELNTFLDKKNIRVIGFTPADLQEALLKNIKDENFKC
jgi:lipoate-protein ligase A